MGALIGPMFLSASLWGSFNEEMYCRQGSTSFLLLVFFSLLNEIVCTHKWTRFSTATTVTIGTLTMALTCLLYLVSAFVGEVSSDHCFRRQLPR